MLNNIFTYDSTSPVDHEQNILKVFGKQNELQSKPDLAIVAVGSKVAQREILQLDYVFRNEMICGNPKLNAR